MAASNIYPTPVGPPLAYRRFAGTLPLADSEDVRLTAYSVERWLADTEARCKSKHLTSIEEMI